MARSHCRLPIADCRLLALLSAVALCVSGCVSRPKVYSAPDASHVTATTKRLSAAIAKSEATRVRADAKVQAAQESSNKIDAHSASVLSLIKELEPFIPAEQKPKFDELKNSVNDQIVEEGNLSASIAGARGEITQLKKDHADEVRERDQLLVDQAKYQADAKQIADEATKESAQKVEYQKQLISQKWFGIFWKIGGVLFVAILIFVGILFALGKLGWAGAKIASKFP